MKAGIYTRVSLDREGDTLAVTRQWEDATQIIERRGWELVAEYQDNDLSAAGKRRRPQFEAMLADIQDGRLQAIIAWSLDRLTRNRTDTVRLIEACQKAGVTIALVRGSDLDMTTPSGRLVADVLASVARAEIETKSDRQKRANLQRAQSGKPHAARRAFGYASNGIDLVPEEAALIRAGYEQILAGASLRSIARAWNTAGATTTAGGPWVSGTVRGVLKNARNAGIRTYNGERMAAGTWPAIISEDVWQATAALLGDPDRSTVKDRTIKFLLTSIAECGRCNDGAKVTTARTQHGVRTYKCQARGDLTRGAAAIDELIEGLVIARLSQPDAENLLTATAPGIDVPALRLEATAQRGRLQEAAQLFADGTIQAGQLATITRASETRIKDLETQIAVAARGSALAGIIGAKNVAAEWSALDISRQRAIVRELFERIVIEPVKRGARTFRPESVEITWRV